MSATLSGPPMHFAIADGDMFRWGALIKTLATGIDHLNGPIYDSRGNFIGKAVADDGTNPALVAAIKAVKDRQWDEAHGNAAVRPMLTKAQFQDLVREQNIIVAKDTKDYDWVDMSQDHAKVLSIRLPSKELLMQQQDNVAKSGGYLLPGHVLDWVTDIVKGTAKTNLEMLDFNTIRVGDYSIKHCEG